MAEQVAHTTVMLREAVDTLVTDPDGFYVDGTFGRGGHSHLILEQLSDRGRLLAIDKDPAACTVARERFADEPRFEIVAGSFAEAGRHVAERGYAGRVAGLLLDLGVSSPQLDDAERGFSFMRDGPLDMRMDPESGISAAEWLAVAGEAEISRVLKEYGEERFARRMARAVVRERAVEPIIRTLQLAKILAEAHPAWEKGRHPATRAFQAIRIFINRELEDLETLLASVVPMLAPGGRLVVISFHSLEDRIVKRFIRRQEHGEPLPRGLPIMEKDRPRHLRSLGKARRPEALEVDANLRSRSAVMRVAEKLS